MNKKVKVVLDTNVFIQALFFQNPSPVKIIKLVQAREIELVFSQDTMGELMYVIKSFVENRISDAKKQETVFLGIAKLIFFSETVNIAGMGDIPEIVDKEDLMFMNTAIASDADYLVTTDFRSGLNTVSGIACNVLTPYQFMEIIDKLKHQNQ
ncbi:putative toxin-antitoxin system toxin component, PIN family [Bacillus sp. DE0042]|uniref:putative toxin-antitoxin system toxin component, PIN family n=1 Tax=Bacillus sp. DE0042 TaxID=2584950 RepID=UPI0011A0F828|nr:putative toxin-antitoxin system toxin component, PIN family [Bacillus sp. DE0042]